MKVLLLMLVGLSILITFTGCSSKHTAPTKTIDYTIVPKKTCK